MSDREGEPYFNPWMQTPIKNRRMDLKRKETARLSDKGKKGVLLFFPVEIRESYQLEYGCGFRLVNVPPRTVVFHVKRSVEPGSVMFHPHGTGGGFIYISSFLKAYGYPRGMEGECGFRFITDDMFEVYLPEECRQEGGK